MQDTSREHGKTLDLESIYGAETAAPAVEQGELELGREGLFWNMEGEAETAAPVWEQVVRRDHACRRVRLLGTGASSL